MTDKFWEQLSCSSATKKKNFSYLPLDWGSYKSRIYKFLTPPVSHVPSFQARGESAMQSNCMTHLRWRGAVKAMLSPKLQVVLLHSVIQLSRLNEFWHISAKQDSWFSSKGYTLRQVHFTDVF